MKKYIYILTALWLFSACTYTERIKDGSTAYDRKQFAVAIPMLLKEYPKAKDVREEGQKAYQLAESYRRTHQYEKSAEWYEKASKVRYKPDAALMQAKMLQQAEKYDEAISAYRTAGRDAGDSKRYMEHIIACRQAKQWLAEADSSDYSVEMLGFNNAATDFSPQVLEEGKLVFSSDREESEGKDKYKWTGAKFFDLYVYDKAKDSVQRYEVENWDPKYHQGTVAFSDDGQKAFFTECGSDDLEGVDFCKIMVAEKSGSSWTKPKAIRLGVSNVNYMHPTVGPDGKWIIFACNNRKGFGGYDLYMSLWVESENRWSEARNLGSGVNTKGDEVFPYVDKDTLYYSSNGFPGMGGLDIYKATNSGHRWQDPVNLKAPLNSGGDDFGLVLDPYVDKADSILQIGFFASNRKGGAGSDDIYRFVREVPKEPVVEDTVETFMIALQLDGLVKENILADPSNPNSEIIGTENLMGATVRISTADTVWTLGSDVDGTFYTMLDTGQTYYLQTTKEGYFSSNDTLFTYGFQLDEENPSDTLNEKIVLTKIQKGKEIVLENVYFDYNKDDIRPDAAKELNKLVDVLKKNPGLRIMMTSHTDCQGRDAYNMDLSQRRAESTRQYLIQNGVDENRLEAKGFGETSPANRCECEVCTDEEHQENRRTSFVVID